MRKNIKSFIFSANVLLVIAMVFAPVVNAVEVVLESRGQAGTTLSAEVTAQGYWKKILEYDWSVEKSITDPAPPNYLEVRQGETAVATYSINVYKALKSEDEKIGVSGIVSVYNGGEVATENLEIILVIQTKVGSGQYQDTYFFPLNLSSNPVLDPGETGNYVYDVNFVPISGALYRVVANITITNHSGSLGTPKGPSPKMDFSLPSQPTITKIDDTATLLSDTILISDDFSYLSGFIEKKFTDSGSYIFDVYYKNEKAMCDTYYTSEDTVKLVEDDNKTEHTDSAILDIYTGLCNTGECRTIGYWKNHAGFTGRNADRVSQYLPIWLGTAGGPKSIKVTNFLQAVTILSTMGSNGINKLMAQLLAAKLNIASGVNGSVIAGVINEADSFLAIKNSADWPTLPKKDQQKVLNWMSRLDTFNNTCN